MCVSVFVLFIDDEEFIFGLDLDFVISDLCNFIEEVCWKNVDVLIYIYGEIKILCYLFNDILCELYGFIYVFEDMLEFVVCYIICEVKIYLEGI